MQKSKSLIEKRKTVFEKLERGDVQDGLGSEKNKRVVEGGGKRMWNVVNRYARVSEGGGEDVGSKKGSVGLTVVLCCGLGFHKEVRTMQYHPFVLILHSSKTKTDLGGRLIL